MKGAKVTLIDFDYFNSLDEQKRCSFLEKLLMILTILPWGYFSHSWHVLSAWAWWHRGWRGFWERSTRGWHGRDTGTHGRRYLGRGFSTVRQGIRLWKSVHQHWSNKSWAPGWRFTWHKSGGQNPCNRVTWCSLFYHFALIVCFFVWLHAAGTTFPIPMVFPARRILEVGVFRFCASRLRQKAHQDAQEDAHDT